MHGRNLFDPTNTRLVCTFDIDCRLSRDSGRSFEGHSFTFNVWLPNLILNRALTYLVLFKHTFFRKDVVFDPQIHIS